jgi:hypothetical protein
MKVCHAELVSASMGTIKNYELRILDPEVNSG